MTTAPPETASAAPPASNSTPEYVRIVRSDADTRNWLQGVLQVSTLLAVCGIIWQGGAKLGRIETQLEQQTKQLEQVVTKIEKQSEDINQFKVSFEQLKSEIRLLQTNRSARQVGSGRN